jgi:hypothetical protein
VTVSTSEFIGLAKTSMESFGAPDMAFVVVPHPIGMIPKEQVIAKADAAFPDILKAATQWKPSRTVLPGLGKAPYPLETIKFKGTVADVNKMFYQKGWSISLPIIPPTKEAVQRMLKGTSHKPSEVVWGAIQPRNGVVTVEMVAAIGVMAGCKPEHMPLLLAIVEAMQVPSKIPTTGSEWRAQTTTTHPTAPLIVVSGPIVKELGIGTGTGAMGPEMPVNNTVGYFVNLLGDVPGGSRPPDADKSTQGWVGNIIATVAGENVDQTPWPKSWPEERGFKKTDNVVIFAGGPPPINENDHASVDPKDLANVMAYTMNATGISRCFGNGGVWILSPEHAATLAREGWSKKDVREYLWQKARAPLWAMPPKVDGVCSITSCCPPPEFGPVTQDTMIPICTSPDQIEFVVVGGPGKQGQWWAFDFSPTPPTMVKVDPWK